MPAGKKNLNFPLRETEGERSYSQIPAKRATDLYVGKPIELNDHGSSAAILYDTTGTGRKGNYNRVRVPRSVYPWGSALQSNISNLEFHTHFSLPPPAPGSAIPVPSTALVLCGKHDLLRR